MRNLSGNARRCMRLALLVLCCLANPVLATLPSGGQVVEGSAHFSQTDTQLNITQESQYLVMDWADFSIGANDRVSITQPSAASAVLIRVLAENPVQIAGRLQANGKVVIVFPAAANIVMSGTIDVGDLYVNTAPISNQDFMAGQLPVHSGVTSASAGTVSATAGTLTLNGGGELTLSGSVATSGSLSGTSAVAPTATTLPTGGYIVPDRKPIDPNSSKGSRCFSGAEELTAAGANSAGSTEMRA